MYLVLVEAMTRCAKLVCIIFCQKLIFHKISLKAEENFENQLYRTLLGLSMLYPEPVVFPNESFFGLTIILTKVFEDYYEVFR